MLSLLRDTYSRMLGQGFCKRDRQIGDTLREMLLATAMYSNS